jgi:hypothetical protein
MVYKNSKHLEPQFLDLFKAFFKQAREELAVRLCDRLFDADGSKNKWWQVSQ